MTASLTLVIPCFREAHRLAPGPFLAFLDQDPTARLLLVDDGSPDSTLEALRRLEAERPDRIEVLALPENRGKGEAVRAGLRKAMEAGPDLVGFWDADLSTPLDASADFRAVLANGPDVHWVIGSRWRGLGRDIRRNPARHYLSRVFATVASVVLGLAVYDTQCGAKIFRADPLLRAVLDDPFVSRWIFDVELLARFAAAHRAGAAPDPQAAVYELALDQWRHDGRSHVRPADFALAFADLWRIRGRYFRRKIR